MPTNPMPPEQARALIAMVRDRQLQVRWHKHEGLLLTQAETAALCDLAEAGLRDGEPVAWVLTMSGVEATPRRIADGVNENLVYPTQALADESLRYFNEKFDHYQAVPLYAARAAHTPEEG